jgi:hypothetical protein
MRWTFLQLFVLALGGIVPLLSFFLENTYTRRVRAFLAQPPAPQVTPTKVTA